MPLMDTGMKALLLAAGLKLQRGQGRRRHTVLEGIDCFVREGEVLMLIGPNGAGKSTLLGALAGDIAPAAGTVRLAGMPLPEWSPRLLARHRAMLSQRSDLTLDFSAEEVVRLGCLARGLGRAEQNAVVEAVLDALTLGELRTRAVPSLSGGEQARIHLGRALAQLWPLRADAGPRLLLLDEPCASLDPYHQHQICQAVRRFARDSGAGVIVTMHDMNLAAQYADRVLALSRGEGIAEGSPGEVLTPDFMHACFNVGAARFSAAGTLLVATHAAADRHGQESKPTTSGSGIDVPRARLL